MKNCLIEELQKKLLFEKKFNKGMNRKIGKYQGNLNKVKKELAEKEAELKKALAEIQQLKVVNE